ncbi:hypothetical protein PFISCL1PPCAC_25430, partial [Pristionchus fissidentatus]
MKVRHLFIQNQKTYVLQFYSSLNEKRRLRNSGSDIRSSLVVVSPATEAVPKSVQNGREIEHHAEADVEADLSRARTVMEPDRRRGDHENEDDLDHLVRIRICRCRLLIMLLRRIIGRRLNRILGLLRLRIIGLLSIVGIGIHNYLK